MTSYEDAVWRASTGRGIAPAPSPSVPVHEKPRRGDLVTLRSQGVKDGQPPIALAISGMKDDEILGELDRARKQLAWLESRAKNDYVSAQLVAPWEEYIGQLRIRADAIEESWTEAAGHHATDDDERSAASGDMEFAIQREMARKNIRDADAGCPESYKSHHPYSIGTLARFMEVTPRQVTNYASMLLEQPGMLAPRGLKPGRRQRWYSPHDLRRMRLVFRYNQPDPGPLAEEPAPGDAP